MTNINTNPFENMNLDIDIFANITETAYILGQMEEKNQVSIYDISAEYNLEYKAEDIEEIAHFYMFAYNYFHEQYDKGFIAEDIAYLDFFKTNVHLIAHKYFKQFVPVKTDILQTTETLRIDTPVWCMINNKPYKMRIAEVHIDFCNIYKDKPLIKYDVATIQNDNESISGTRKTGLFPTDLFATKELLMESLFNNN